MKPLKLTMQAFASYGQNTVIDFRETNQNLFLITGDTGAGKTTIFDAIVFALYGEASSGNNKKKGQELQSQYGDYILEPYVELTFSEGYGDNRGEYTVRRVPRHKRYKKKGSGYKDERETVSLTMPDGSDHTGKNDEINRKLEEIVGLTKNQFMQVGMIAQGEFMELLRASTGDKIPIFRKLFHTDLYYELENELLTRCRDKQSDIARIKIACQTEIGHIEVPEDYDQATEILTIKDKILGSERLYSADMESLTDKLESMCGWIIGRDLENQDHLKKARLERDKHRDACQAGEKLAQSYGQLDQAEEELLLCRQEEAEIRSLENLVSEINISYDIRAVYDSYKDAEGRVEETRSRLKKHEELLPSLKAAYVKAEEEERRAENEKEVEIASYSKIQEKVNKAVSLFKEIGKTEKEIITLRESRTEAENMEKTAKQTLKDMENQENIWRKQYQDLSGIPLKEERHRIAYSEIEGIKTDYDEVKNDLEEWVGQKKYSERAKSDYIKARDAYNQANDHFVEQQNAFYDAQAGIIAREKLIPGQPCPVCGSTHHPNPHILSSEHQNLTRDHLDKLNRDLLTLQKKMTEKSEDSVEQSQTLRGMENGYSDHKKRLIERMLKNGYVLSGIMVSQQSDKTGLSKEEEGKDLYEIENLIKEKKGLLDQEGLCIKSDKELYLSLEEKLDGVEEKKRKLQEKIEDSSRSLASVAASLAAWEEKRNTLLDSREFTSPEDAKNSLKQAHKKKQAIETAYQKAHEDAQKSKKSKEAAETLISQCRDVLPGYCKSRDERNESYLNVMRERGFDQERWMNVVSFYKKEDIGPLRQKIEAHIEKKTTAKTRKETALALIGGQPRPDLARLQENMTRAEAALSERQKVCDLVRRYRETDEKVLQNLSPRMEERGKIMEEYNRLDSLYQRLAGKVSGSRMDIETFVQRYYLERILHSANLRFQEMSGGQYILRMYELEKAGEGKNHGLDLMVYSTVTGTMREVRTLSGGESFMAALSLALGMADQIQEKSAAINLDMMFIDEGFGSLDDNSRGQAVKMLHNMADSSKLIGIISHVTELKQEIEDQLVITKDKDGSHHRWVIS